MHVQHITNNRVSLPRKEQQKAAADTAKVLSGLNMQPGKLLIDMLIDFNDCKRFEQLTQQVNPAINIESGVKIEEVPALVDTGANVIAPVLISLAFLRIVLPDDCIAQFLSKVKQNVSGADGKGNLAIVGRLSVLLAIRPLDQDTVPFLLKVDAALMEPLAGEVIISGELLLQNGATIHYPIPGVREAFIKLDRLGNHRYPWYNTNQLMDLQYQLNSGKTVTWFTQDQHQRITAINYPISHALEGSEEVVTYADTKLYPGEARELQIRQWTGRADPEVCRYFEPLDELMFRGHLGPIPSGQVRPMAGILYGGPHPTQNVIMLNQSAEVVTIRGGTVIGTATAMNNPNAPQLICDWGHLEQSGGTGGRGAARPTHTPVDRRTQDT